VSDSIEAPMAPCTEKAKVYSEKGSICERTRRKFQSDDEGLPGMTTCFGDFTIECRRFPGNKCEKIH
jgi:hypothetical protein